MDTLTRSAEAKDEKADNLPEQPYPGLNFYEKFDNIEVVFAGRKDDVDICMEHLQKSKVLVLHGRTGCGKSSFLRAGLAPRLEISPSYQTQKLRGKDNREEWMIWRTGAWPVQTLARAFYRFYEDVEKQSEDPEQASPRPSSRRAQAQAQAQAQLAPLDTVLGIDRAPFVKKFGDDKEKIKAAVRGEFIKLVEDKPSHLLATIRNLWDARPGLKKVVFVLDQAEEMWTLSKGSAGAAKKKKSAEGAEQAEQAKDAARSSDPDGKSGHAQRLDAETAQKERNKLFDLISELESDGRIKGVHLLISMRTEYKGQFDDELELRANVAKREKREVRGYYLEELGLEAIKEAIKQPTRDHVEGHTVSPRRKYRFRYEGEGRDASGQPEPDLPAMIAQELLNEEKGVPRGGILPVLQVTCLRLWETVTSRPLARGETEWVIKRSDFEQLGEINRQIELFVQDRLEKALAEAKERNVLNEAEKWYRMLNSALVNIESDGRVTTKKASPANLREEGVKMGLAAFTGERDRRAGDKMSNAKFSEDTAVGKIFDYLAENNILRQDDRLREGQEVAEWSLGHDSVGLTLNRWSQVYGTQFDSVSKMDMMASTTPDKFVELDTKETTGLYGSDHRPERYKLSTLRDSVWDHQILQFAVDKGFARRLGIDIIDEFDTVGGEQQKVATSANEGESTETTMSVQSALRQLDRVDPEADKAAYVIAWPRAEFPWSEDQLTNWTDLVITNAYQGYGLLCPPDVARAKDVFKPFDGLRRDIQASSASGDVSKEAYEDALKSFRASMIHVGKFLEKNSDAEIWLFDKSAGGFIDLVLDITCYGMNSGEAAWLRRMFKRGRIISNDAVDPRVRDPIFAKILENTRRVDFMVGTAFGRALAERTQYKSQIDVQDLVPLIEFHLRAEITDDDSKRRRERELHKAFQKTQTHTTWQLSVPHDEIKDERMEALIYRLASLGFYTSEYIRTNADVFVRFIDEHLQKTSPPGTFKLDRENIRRSVRSCYAFFTFEQYASQFLERRSPMAYWQEDGNDTSRLRDIHSRMLAFRAQFYEDFQEFNEQYIRLTKDVRSKKRNDTSDHKDESKEEALHNARVLDNATVLRERAWNHLKILNFYDAARFMRMAREELSRVMAQNEQRHRMSSGEAPAPAAAAE